ncbi:MAG: HepT-like ribonuclease domain-containing protein [Chitinophagales bacterium]|nr:HepT-like ribonuclease domain-containing protein [Chitinophagales bacterium]
MSDILSAILLIEEFTSGVKDFEAYQKDKKTRSAVERQLAIIGEAVSRFTKENPDEVLQNSGQIIAFRNWLIHAYDSINNTTVWAILQRHLPLLKNEVMEKLKE